MFISSKLSVGLPTRNTASRDIICYFLAVLFWPVFIHFQRFFRPLGATYALFQIKQK
jgi:hypothetical protein